MVSCWKTKIEFFETMDKNAAISENQNNIQPLIVSRDEWTAAHKKHLEAEKELTLLYDTVTAKRKKLPWVKVEKEYKFWSENGQVTFADLFQGRSQLVVQHFMFGLEDSEGCVGCSFSSDHVDSASIHFEQNDLSYVCIARAPIAKLTEYKKRMGWSFKWVSSEGSDFNYDYHVSFRKEDLQKGKVLYNFEMHDIEIEDLPGHSVFYKNNDGDIFHTFSTYGRADEALIGAYNYLDIAPKGRNENGPNGDLTDWVRHHDRYESDADITDNYRDNDTSQSCCSSTEVKL